MKNKYWIIILLIISFSVGVFYYFYYGKKFQVIFFDVGQGDSALIKTVSGNDVLIDAGPDKFISQKLSNNLSFFDNKIEYIILTHPHSDHLSGFIPVLRRYSVGTVIMSGVNYTSLEYKKFRSLLLEKKIPVIIIDKKQVIDIDSELSLSFIYPDVSFEGKKVVNLNNTSLVFRIEYEGVSFLFTGDIESEVENTIASLDDFLPITVLKVAHHGSRSSSISRLTSLVSPMYAIISVGKKNKYGHPSFAVLNRFEEQGVRVFRTDYVGDVFMSVINGQLGVSVQRLP